MGALDGRAAIVTGSGRGVGLAVAKALAAAGARVLVNRKVVNVTSVSGTFGSPGQPNYAAAKAGLVGLTKTVAKEWGGLKVNVNAVAFGFVETRMTAPREEAEVFDSDGEQVKLGVPAQMLEMAIPQVPIGRKATPEEAAAPILFLCSPGSNYIMGQVLTVGGGLAGGMSS